MALAHFKSHTQLTYFTICRQVEELSAQIRDYQLIEFLTNRYDTLILRQEHHTSTSQCIGWEHRCRRRLCCHLQVRLGSYAQSVIGLTDLAATTHVPTSSILFIVKDKSLWNT